MFFLVPCLVDLLRIFKYVLSVCSESFCRSFLVSAFGFLVCIFVVHFSVLSMIVNISLIDRRNSELGYVYVFLIVELFLCSVEGQEALVTCYGLLGLSLFDGFVSLLHVFRMLVCVMVGVVKREVWLSLNGGRTFVGVQIWN